MDKCYPLKGNSFFSRHFRLAFWITLAATVPLGIIIFRPRPLYVQSANFEIGHSGVNLSPVVEPDSLIIDLLAPNGKWRNLVTAYGTDLKLMASQNAFKPTTIVIKISGRIDEKVQSSLKALTEALVSQYSPLNRQAKSRLEHYGSELYGIEKKLNLERSNPLYSYFLTNVERDILQLESVKARFTDTASVLLPIQNQTPTFVRRMFELSIAFIFVFVVAFTLTNSQWRQN